VILAVVDRIESGVAVLELQDGDILTVPAVELPDGVVEGELVKVTVERVAPDDTQLPPTTAD
jgi:hypothetical protein